MKKVNWHFLSVAILGSGLLLSTTASAWSDHSSKGWGGNGHNHQNQHGFQDNSVVAESTVYSNGYTNRFVVNRSGQLIQFSSYQGSNPVRYEISAPLGEQGSLIDVRAIFTSNLDVSAFVLNRRGQLEQYHWSPVHNQWIRHYITRDINGPLLNRLTSVRFDGQRMMVSGIDRNNRRITYSWSHHTGWIIRY